MNYIDYTICGVYVLLVAAIGLWAVRRDVTPRDFFLAGRGLGWFPIGISLMVTLASSLGFIGAPTAAMRGGIRILWSLLAFPLAYPIVTRVFIPFYQRLEVYTPYEYLERRFDIRIRLLASTLFILWRITWMAATLYVVAMVLNVASAGSFPLIPSILVLGLLATAYTAFGGLRAVIWTDILQFFVLFGGIITFFFFLFHKIPGGLPSILTTLSEAGKLAPLTPTPTPLNTLGERVHWYLYTDFTVFAIIFSFTLDKMGNYCVDQVMVQRYLSASSLKAARRGFLLNCFAFATFFTLMTAIGLLLFTFNTHFPAPKNLRIDALLPYFLSHHMPAGFIGLFLAALLAAAMSSIDSGVNSCITAFFNDFYHRLRRHEFNLDTAQHFPKTALWGGSLLLGLLVIFLACYMRQLGDAFQIALKVLNSYLGILFGIFTLALFTKRTHARGLLIAVPIAAIFSFLLVFASKGSQITAFSPAIRDFFHHINIGFLWISIIGYLTTLFLGYSLSLLWTDPANNSTQWRFHDVMKK